ncbi:MAG: cupredoxin domain-containing protein [Ktedonobacterales bacterium]
MTHADTKSTIEVQAPRASQYSRQPLSVMAKVALGAFAVGTLLNGIVVLILTIALGAPSRDSVTTAIGMLVATIFIASGIFWLQAAAAVLGGYLTYALFTEPFVVESLANPKGPNGGYGHFVGDVIACACVLVGFGASVATVVLRYRRASNGIPRWLPSALSVVAGTVIGALFIGALAQPPTAAGAGTTYTNGVPTVHMSAGGFTQSTVTISTGSKLLLVDDTSSLHILANGTWQNRVAKPGREPGAPEVKNVSVSGNQIEIGPFATAGTYHIYCVVHPGMELTVVVQ